MSVTRDMRQSYLRPRQVMRRHLAAGENEARALAFLMAACVIIFVSQWPVASRDAFLDPSVPLQARLGGALMGWVVIAPLLFYLLAAILHGVTKLFRSQATGYETRLALFWALLASSPMFLLNGLVAGFIGPGVELNLTGVLLLGVFFYIWVGAQWEAGWPGPENDTSTV